MNGRILAMICVSTLVLLAPAARAQERKDVEQELRRSLIKPIFELKVPYASTVLRYNDKGGLMGAAVAGPWTTDGLFQITNLWLDETALEIEGLRVIVVLDPTKPSGLLRVQTDRPIHITIKFHSGLLTVDQLREVTEKVFSVDTAEQHFKEYWKPLANLDESCTRILRAKPDGIVATLRGEPVYYCLPPTLVTAPKPIDTRAPTYTGQTRRDKVQGTCELLVAVDADGLPEILKVKHRLEPTLDIHAMQAVAEWKFRPAMKGGKPVAYLLIVKVGFHYLH